MDGGVAPRPSMGLPPPLLRSSRLSSQPAIQKGSNNEVFIISIARIEMGWRIHWQSVAKLKNGLETKALARNYYLQNLFWIPAARNNYVRFKYLRNSYWIPAALL